MGMNNMIHIIRQMSERLGSNIYAGVQGSNPQHISFLRQLQKEMKQKNQLDEPFQSLEVVAFDLETTGFYPENGDAIISVGAVKMNSIELRNEDSFYSLVKCKEPISEQIKVLTGITNEQLAEAPPAAEVLLNFFKFIESKLLVAHHAKHETAFMQRAMWEFMRTRFEHRIVDTSFVCQLFDPALRSASLEEVCDLCGVEVRDRHHALGDAIMTAEIWRVFLRKAVSMGFTNLREVYEYIAKMR